MRFKQITIIGVGLIGGSIGLAAKKHKLAARIVGVTAHKESLKKALKRRAIDFGTLDLKKSVLNSDMIILATPVDKVISTLKVVSPNLKKGCIVIDVASVKQAIVRKAEKIVGRKGSFIGAHPMAGSEQRGVEKADGNLFKNALCVLTKTKNTDAKALKAVHDFWKALGSKIRVLSAEEHDKKISNISHLPHIAASCLSLTAQPASLEFAATGFRDVTRIASSDPALWTSILMSNRGNVAKDIKSYIKQLEKVRHLIVNGKESALRRALISAKKKRDKLLINGR